MASIRIRAAVESDRADVESLLRSASLPLDGLDNAWGHAVVAEDDRGRVVGAAALEPYEGAGLLRSVVVHPEVQGQGIGHRLVRHMIHHAAHRGCRKLYLLTDTAEKWFASLGFERVERSAVPDDIRGSAEFTGACPDSAVAMVLHRLDA